MVFHFQSFMTLNFSITSTATTDLILCSISGEVQARVPDASAVAVRPPRQAAGAPRPRAQWPRLLQVRLATHLHHQLQEFQAHFHLASMSVNEFSRQ